MRKENKEHNLKAEALAAGPTWQGILSPNGIDKSLPSYRHHVEIAKT